MPMPKIISATEAAKLVKDGDKLLIGTFLGIGCAQTVIDALVETGQKNLKTVSISPDYDDFGMGKLLANGQVTHVQTSWHGFSKASQKGFHDGSIKIEFNPQGNLIERVRAAGAGLGGIITPVGLGTPIEDERETIMVDGKKWILDKPIHGDVSIIKAYKGDKMGNLIYRKSARNCNPIMATAGKIVIAEIEELVEVGDFDQEEVITPGVYIDYIVVGKRSQVYAR